MTKHMHQATASRPSPFLAVHTSPYIDSASKLPTKTPTTPDRNAVTRSISPCFSTISDTKTFYSAIETTDICLPEGVSSTVTELECPTPDSDISMEGAWPVTDKQRRDDAASSHRLTIQDDLATPKRQASSQRLKGQYSLSRGSSTSQSNRRSTSQSTENRSSLSHRRVSRRKPHRIPTDHSQTSTGSPYRRSYSAISRQKHHDLLSLHQDSCRLFQTPENLQDINGQARPSLKRDDSCRQDNPLSQGDRGQGYRPSYPARSHMRSYSTPVRNVTNSTTAESVAHSSLLNSYGIYLPSHLEPGSRRESEVYPSGTTSFTRASCPNRSASESQYYQEDPDSIYKPIPPTIIDWTSPSTRKREYEKIDRSYRGIRGFWRRFAPHFFQPGDRRTPFFEEGKGGNGVYGGSVRRFRMDFSDEEEDNVQEERVDVRDKARGDRISRNYNGDATARASGPSDSRGRRKWKRFKFMR
ncbi:hypothetical protein FQN54_000824 [Arachnomyces sp. PD_36]|nr:hypothetical protein FQN54_000824 [Arachnomyces sp. PD_36]